MNNRVRRISGGWFWLLAIWVLILPVQWICACLIAALVHECSHRLAIYLVSEKWVPIRLYPLSMRMPLPEMRWGAELFCALAGPIGGGALLLIGRWMPRVAFCAATHSLLNLLPVYPLDGGRAIRCLLCMGCTPPVAAKIEKTLAGCTRIGLLFLGSYACLGLKLGLLPMLLCLLILFRIK